MKIKVTIPKQETKAFGEQPVLLGTHMVGRLKEAGVPVTGVLWPSGVENGELRSTVSVEGTTYEWEGEDEVLY